MCLPTFLPYWTAAKTYMSTLDETRFVSLIGHFLEFVQTWLCVPRVPASFARVKRSKWFRGWETTRNEAKKTAFLRAGLEGTWFLACHLKSFANKKEKSEAILREMAMQNRVPWLFWLYCASEFPEEIPAHGIIWHQKRSDSGIFCSNLPEGSGSFKRQPRSSPFQ